MYFYFDTLKSGDNTSVLLSRILNAGLVIEQYFFIEERVLAIKFLFLQQTLSTFT